MLRRLYWMMTAIRSDRGEGPVPYIVLVAVMSVAAAAIAAAIWGVGLDWLDNIETEVPEP